MIFSKFFKSKWQHKDAAVRVAAINEELDNNNTEQRKTLLNLLENDQSELVRRAVLLKINQFSDWLDASSTNNNAKVREYAQKQVNLIVKGQHDIKLSVQEKLSYLSNIKKSSLLEDWLQTEQSPQVVIELLNKIAKPQLLISVFAQKQQPEVQQYIVEQTSDKSHLEKLLKKSQLDEVTALINEKLQLLLIAEEKPVKLKKHAQLVLSKLLALKEQPDYEQVLIKKQKLVNEWQAINSELEQFLQEEYQTLLDKFQSIEAQLTKVFAIKAEEFEQLKIARQLEEQKSAAIKLIDNAIEKVGQAIATAVFESGNVEESVLQDNIAQIGTQVSESVLPDNEKHSYQQKLNSLKEKLTQVPLIAESVTEATHLISKISQLTVPESLSELNEKHTLYLDWQNSWQQVEKNADGFIPESIVNAYKEVSDKWQHGLKPLLTEQKNAFSHTQRKVSELKRLIASGKFNASFGVFKKTKSLFETLSSQQQSRLQRDMDNLTEKMSDLSDWEHYIATPRKQSLLEEVQQLIENPLDNPNEQANKVKAFRKTWNSLGHADDEVENELNNQFNTLIEQAFAPCRQFYAEQEKIREQNLVVRNQLIEEAKSLAKTIDSDSIDWKQLDGDLNKLHSKWQQSGEIDRNKYKQLQSTYSDILKPLKEAIKAYHLDNVKLKNTLITKAKSVAEQEDVYAAVSDIKALQEEWRNIGYAGPKEENALWAKFRAINDTLFKKRDELKQQVQSKQQETKQLFEEQIAELREQLNANKGIADLSNLLTACSELKDKVFEEKPVIKSVLSAIDALIKDINKVKSEIIEQKTKQDWQNLFTILELLVSKDNATDISEIDGFDDLSATWKKKLVEVSKKDNLSDRSQKTIELEILAGIDSPKELTEQRLNVQVSLMQEQMQSSNSVDLQAIFIEWLAMGKLSEQDNDFLARIKPIFC